MSQDVGYHVGENQAAGIGVLRDASDVSDVGVHFAHVLHRRFVPSHTSRRGFEFDGFVDKDVAVLGQGDEIGDGAV
ncbi:hypothetical protein [Arthrobacter sp. D2-10]